MSLLKKYPRTTSLLLLAVILSFGYYRNAVTEEARVRAVVEFSLKADADIRNLIFAYQLRSGTVRSLAEYAQKRKIEVPHAVRTVLSGAETPIPDVKNVASIRNYLVDQIKLTSAAKDLITMMDAELPPTDAEFGKLFREFQAEEESLSNVTVKVGPNVSGIFR